MTTTPTLPELSPVVKTLHCPSCNSTEIGLTETSENYFCSTEVRANGDFADVGDLANSETIEFHFHCDHCGENHSTTRVAEHSAAIPDNLKE